MGRIAGAWLLLFALNVQGQEREAQPVSVEAQPGHGLTMRTGDERFELTMTGRLQVRGTLRADGEVTRNLTVQTVRLSWEGYVLSPDLQYTVQLGLGANDFEPYTPSPILDAYVEYAGSRLARLRVGQFFVPFDRARMMREVGLQFVERQQMVDALTLDRDVGIQLHSTDLFDGHAGYHLGVFSGDGRNLTRPRAAGLLYLLRLVIKPFGDFETDEEGDIERGRDLRLAVGVAGAFNHGAGRIRSTGGPSFEQGSFDYTHFTADAILKYRGLYVLVEQLYRRGHPRARDEWVDGELVREWSRSAWGYLLQGGYMATAQLEGVWRYNELFAISPTDPDLEALVARQGREAALGFNVYLNGHRFKLQADYTVRFGRGAVVAEHVGRAALDASF